MKPTKKDFIDYYANHTRGETANYFGTYLNTIDVWQKEYQAPKISHKNPIVIPDINEFKYYYDTHSSNL